MSRIVVGIDGSKGSDLALAWAADEARLRGADLRIVHCWHPPYADGFPVNAIRPDPQALETAAQTVLDTSVAAIDTSGIPTVETKLRLSGASAALTLESEDADLVVVGARGLGGFAGLLLGSVSAQVAHHASCPVVVVTTPQ